MTNRSLIARFFVIASAWSAGAACSAQEYRLVDLGSFKPRGRMATTADGRLLIPGVTLDAAVPTVCVYTKKGAMFPTFPASSNHMWAYTTAVNKNGDVSGEDWSTQNARCFALVWRADGQVVTLGSWKAHPAAMNDRGMTVGSMPASVEAGYGSPVVWLPGVPVMSLANSAYPFGTATDASNRGEVVGYQFRHVRNERGFNHPFKWSRAGGMRWLPRPDAADGTANSVNEAGAAVGQAYYRASQTSSAVLWDADGTLHLLAQGGMNTQASAINDHNVVVGESWAAPGGEGWVWTKKRGLTALSSLVKVPKGWVLQSPHSIDSDGNIAGVGLYQGSLRGFLLVAIKAPERAKPKVAEKPAAAPAIKP